MIAGLLMFAALAAVGSDDGAAGAVTDAQVDVEVASARRRIDRCVFEAAGLPSMPPGKIEVRWQIAADGTSTDVVVVVDTLGLSTATACVTAAVANLRFQAAPAGRSVERTLDFPLAHGGGLSREHIQRVVGDVLPRVKRCYDDVLAKDPASAGEVRFVWKVLGTGEVSDVGVEVDTLAKPEATACMREVVSSLRFQQPTGYGVVTIHYPFVFSTTEHPRLLSRRTIDNVLWSARPRIDRCSEEAGGGKAAAGAVRLTWKILETGVVQDVAVDLDTLARPAVTACLRAVVASLEFPALAGRETVATAHPFVFPSSSSPGPSSSSSSSSPTPPTAGCGDWWPVGRRAPPAPPSSTTSATTAPSPSSSNSAGAMRW